MSKWCLNFVERLINNIPLINSVYQTVKQLVDTISQSKKSFFQQAVLVEFPSKGLYSIGFLTNNARGEVQEKTKEDVRNVFVPTTPNPTTGFLLMVPNENIVYLDMSIGEAMKIIISAGAVTPDQLKKSTAIKLDN